MGLGKGKRARLLLAVTDKFTKVGVEKHNQHLVTGHMHFPLSCEAECQCFSYKFGFGGGARVCVCVGGGRVRKRGTIKDLGGGGGSSLGEFPP